ncbi:MAG: arylsulfatase [Eubacteriales bacterium]
MNKKPNVIIILTDDQGYGDIAAHGNPWIQTPCLDWLSENSVSLEDFHTDPLCAPARSALMTGKYSFGAGVYSTLNGRYYMKPELKTMADYFKQGGYATGMFGKWHLGDSYPYQPENRGFDVAYSFGGGVIGETPDYWNNNYYDDVYTVNGQEKQFEGYCTDVWFDSAMRFMDKEIDSDNPFFCYLPVNAPHGPYNVNAEYYQKYLDMGIPDRRARFYGMIECVDENIGKLMKHLQDKKVFDDTIIIYFGDNGTSDGCVTDEDGWVQEGYNAGMRGKKGTTYEGAHRNACFITTPSNRLGEARKVYGITAQMDLLPTLIDICDLPKGEDLDGISMASALQEGRSHVNYDRTLVVHNMQRDMPQKFKDYTVLKNNMRLVRPLTNETNPFLLGSFGSSVDVDPEIYDISIDPYEERDCHKEYEELGIELTRYYEEWYDERLEEAMKYSPIYLTKDHPVKMTCHAWHECTKMCFSQKNVREGVDGNGYFSMKVEDAGVYTFELRRYPRESGLALDATCEALLRNEQIYEDWCEGRSYKIVAADIRMAGQREEATVKQGQESVTFALQLPQGEYHLRTRFFLESGKSIGAYYVYAEYKK